MSKLMHTILGFGLRIAGIIMILKNDPTGVSAVMGAQAIIMAELLDNKVASDMQSIMLAKLYKKQFPEEFKDDKQG